VSALDWTQPSLGGDDSWQQEADADTEDDGSLDPLRAEGEALARPFLPSRAAERVDGPTYRRLLGRTAPTRP
jgi:hypothetical protein